MGRVLLYFPKRSFNKIGSADLPPQGHLDSLKLLRIHSQSLLGRKLYLMKENKSSIRREDG
jgi:hypothetical protein